jgi:hypothetical protein
MSTRPENRERTNPSHLKSDVHQEYDKRGDPDDVGAVTWRFRRSASREWRWERIHATEDVARQSSSPFESYEDCVADAQAAGYKPMIAAANLVPLCLVSHPQPIPAALNFDVEEWPGPAKRSTVLKKRVAHPAVERIFGKHHRPAAIPKRTKGTRRLQTVTSFVSSRSHARIHGKSRLNRA